MNTKGWLVLPNRSRLKELSEEESYARLLELKREASTIIEQRRERKLTDGQKKAIERFIDELIKSKARIRYYQNE